ncbi:MAG: hypothetical protein V1723_03585 [Candidatus Uhrbacteria bacterium]
MSHVDNFRKVVLFALGALALMIGVHRVALFFGASPVFAVFIALIAVIVFVAAGPVAVARVALECVVVLAFAASYVVNVLIAVLIAVVLIAIAYAIAYVATSTLVATFATAAFAFAIAATAAFVIAAFSGDANQLKNRWVALVFGIEYAAVYTAFAILPSIGPGALVGIGGAALLGALWFLAPQLEQAFAVKPRTLA